MFLPQKVLLTNVEQMAFVQYLPQYVFCHHGAFMMDPPLRQTGESIERYDNHHNLCNLPGLSLNKKLNRPRWPRGGLLSPPKSIVPSLESIELMYESFELQLSMFGVCHQLREEAMEIYYMTNTFSFVNAAFFNIFLSRFTYEKAFLLRKVEFIYDQGDFCTWVDKRLTSPTRWKLGVVGFEVLERLANITDITIRYSNMLPEEITPLKQRLREDFGGLGRLKKIVRVNVQAYAGSCPRYERLMGISKPSLDEVCLKEVGHEFAKEILSGGKART